MKTENRMYSRIDIESQSGLGFTDILVSLAILAAIGLALSKQMAQTLRTAAAFNKQEDSVPSDSLLEALLGQEFSRSPLPAASQTVDVPLPGGRDVLRYSCSFSQSLRSIYTYVECRRVSSERSTIDRAAAPILTFWLLSRSSDFERLAGQ
jgi:hypothetical protein